jgi:hypothetical protein
MQCSVCKNEMGLWARLSAHSSAGVCKDCQKQASNQIHVLLSSVSATQSFKLQFAQGWVNQFDETVRKYHMAESEVGPLRLSLLNDIFKLVEAEDEMPDDDLKFLASVGQKYGLGQSATPELRDTIFRVGTKEVIQSWERGETPHKDCGGLVLQKGEVCHWEEGAGLRVQKIKHEYVGGYSSVSVPVPLVRGVRFRVGGFKGHPIDHTILEDGGTGVLHITNQRVCFAGQQRSVAIPYKKMISVGGFEGGFVIRTSNEKKPGIFIVRNPELTTHLLTLAANPPGEQEPSNKRPKKVLPTS